MEVRRTTSEHVKLTPARHARRLVVCMFDAVLEFPPLHLCRDLPFQILPVGATVTITVPDGGGFENAGDVAETLKLTDQTIHTFVGGESHFHTDFSIKPPAKPRKQQVTEAHDGSRND